MHIRSYLFLFFSLLSLGAVAQPVSYKNESGFRSDNDSYLGINQDQYYTNGLFIYFRRAMDQNGRPNIAKQIWEIELGQKMYNPFSGSVPKISQIDRPFAAYLFAGASLNRFYQSENNLKISLQAGTIGPRALGRQAQELFHKIGGFYKLKGWETQIKNEFGFNGILEYNHFLYRNPSQKIDFTLTGTANLGNTFSGAALGTLIRLGNVNQLFHSASANSSISNNASTHPLLEREFFFFAKPSLNFIAYDATIEGGLFQKEKEVATFGVYHWVFSQQLGLMYSKKRWTADFSLTFKSREVKSWAKAHQYGSVGLLYRFN